MYNASYINFYIFLVLLYIIISIYVCFTSFYPRKNKIFFFNIKKKKINWIDIWNINTNISTLENINESSWNLYLKYKLTMITSWHILEERFLIFFIIIIVCFF